MNAQKNPCERKLQEMQMEYFVYTCFCIKSLVQWFFMFYVGDVQQRRGPVESGENPTSGPAMLSIGG